jgi:hypothetical protein
MVNQFRIRPAFADAVVTILASREVRRLAPAWFKVYSDNALKLGVIDAGASLFVLAPRRMTAPSAQSAELDRAMR